MSAGRSAARWARADRVASGSVVETELISRLRALPGPAPELQFRTDLRAQLVAITARIVSESPAEAAPRPGALAGRRSRAVGGRALRTLRRPVLALASASTVLVLLLGMAVWMSSGSLPGQSLYGVKRASENVQLSMAGNDVAKGQAYLHLAGNRVREAADLLSQPSAMLAAGGLSAAGRLNPRTATLVIDTLDSADADSVNGMQLLGRAAVAQLSKEPLVKMSDWLPQQRTLMTEVQDRIPAGPVRTRAQASLLLLQRIALRASQLSTAMGCPCLAQALADELGPVPCVNCAAVPTNPTPGGASGGATATVPVPGPGAVAGSAGSGSSSGSGSGSGSGLLPSLSLPGLGGSGSAGSGQPGGPAATQPAAPSLSPSLPGTQPSAPLPPGNLTSGLPSVGPLPSGSASLPITVPGLPGLPGVIGGSGGTSLLPPLPGVSGP
jgi:hypothetical protein